MNIYDIEVIENQLEKIALENEGEIPEELLQELIEAQTQSLVQIENLCKYVRHLELFSEKAKEEKQRIETLKVRADNRIENIKKYLLPYIQKNGKIEAGIFKLSIRKSKSVNIIDENFYDSRFSVVDMITKHDKKALRKALDAGEEIKGVELNENENLQIK